MNIIKIARRLADVLKWLFFLPCTRKSIRPGDSKVQTHIPHYWAHNMIPSGEL